MKRIVRIIGIVIMVALIFFMGKCFLMVACISCTTPPIKTYRYVGSMDQFEYNVKHFILVNPTMSCSITRRGGVNDARDIVIKTKSNNNNIKYDLVLYKFNDATDVDLSDIYDETNHTGGNDIKQKAVSDLYDDFKNNFLLKLENEEHIVLKHGWLYL
jgi:hypothetical protein